MWSNQLAGGKFGPSITEVSELLSWAACLIEQKKLSHSYLLVVVGGELFVSVPGKCQGMQWCVVACLWSVPSACSCSPLCVCLGNSQRHFGWTHERSSACSVLSKRLKAGVFGEEVCMLHGQKSSNTERGLHLSVVVVLSQDRPSAWLQPVSRPVSLLYIKGDIAQSSRQSLSCRVHTLTCQPGWTLSPLSLPISSQPMGSQSPRHLERANQQHTHTHCRTHTHSRAANQGLSFIKGLPVLVSFSRGGEVLRQGRLVHLQTFFKSRILRIKSACSVVNHQVTFIKVKNKNHVFPNVGYFQLVLRF